MRAQVRWRPDMPPDARRTRKKAQQQTYNIVVASYVLGELPTPHEREALVRQLWSEWQWQERLRSSAACLRSTPA